MLERCLLGPITTPLSSFPITYAARLNVADGLFSIVEKTHYSNEVVHFSLPMTRGDDKAVQEYLASRLELSLSVASRQSHNILQLNATLQNEVEQKEQYLQELYDLRYRSTAPTVAHHLTLIPNLYVFRTPQNADGRAATSHAKQPFPRAQQHADGVCPQNGGPAHGVRSGKVRAAQGIKRDAGQVENRVCCARTRQDW